MVNDRPHVLIANEDSELRATINRLLTGRATCVETTSGRDALRALDSHAADCVLIDARLSENDGGALFDAIAVSGCNALVLTGEGDDAAAEQAIARGALVSLSKADLSAELLMGWVRCCVEIKRARARAESAESRYRDLFNEAPVMYAITADGTDAIIRDCNRLFATTVGCQRDAIIGESLFEFCDDSDGDGRDREILDLYSTPDECELRTRGGATVPAIVHAVPERDDSGVSRGARVMFVNIARRKEAEEALRRSESEMRALLDANPDTLIKLTEVAGDVLFDPVRTHLQLDDEDPVVAAHADLAESTVESFRRHAGLAFEGGPPLRFEYELTISDAPRTFEARLVRLSKRELLAIIREQTRERELEQQLLQSQRLEAVGKLAGGVAHDFNNFLTVITGNAELALLDLDGEDPNVPIYREIVETSGRAADLTRQLLAFSRQQILKLSVLDLNQLVVATERMLGRLIGEDIEIDARLETTLPLIKADPGQIEQILVNLAVNARDAMPTGGRLSFETATLELFETEAGHEFDIPSGCYVRLAVRDTGVGMDEVTRRHVFEPFFTTKQRGQGTGLGLATVYGIVKQSDGFIRVDSEPGAGSMFQIYFPCATEAELENAQSLTSPPEEGRGETVVFVEDDAGVLSLARSILERGGYRVAAFQKGEDAVRFVREDPSRVDLLATDVVMPEMSGRSVADTVLSVRNDIPVLFVSGYLDDARMRHGVREAEMNLLEKPFSRAELLFAVRRSLEVPPRL